MSIQEITAKYHQAYNTVYDEDGKKRANATKADMSRLDDLEELKDVAYELAGYDLKNLPSLGIDSASLRG